MKNLKRALCLFLALVMCLSMLPMNVFAASIAEGAEAGVTEGTGNEPAPEGGEADEPEGATTPGDSENSEETGDSQDSEEVKNESEGNEGTEDPADNTVETKEPEDPTNTTADPEESKDPAEPEDPTKPVVVDPAKLVEENDGTEEEALEVANLFTLVAGAYLTDEEDLNEVKFPAKLYFKADDVDEQFDFIEASFPEEDTEPEVVALTEDAITWQGTEVEVTFIPDEAATYEELLAQMEDDGSDTFDDSGNWVYVYLKVSGAEDAIDWTSLNKDGWFTIGRVWVPNLPAVSTVPNYKLNKYLSTVTAQLSNIELFSDNAGMFDLTDVKWSGSYTALKADGDTESMEAGLKNADGATNYVPSNTTREWHLDGFLEVKEKHQITVKYEFARDDYPDAPALQNAVTSGKQLLGYQFRFDVPTYDGYRVSCTESKALNGVLQVGSEDRTVTIVYTKTQTVTYAIGEHGTFTQQSDTVDYGNSVPAFRGTTTGESGWEFDGWSINAPETVTEDLVFTAKWKRSTADLIYDANGGSKGTGTGTQTQVTEQVTITDAFSVPNGDAKGFTRPGYTFDGWSATADGDQVSTIEISATTENHLYARWIEIAPVLPENGVVKTTDGQAATGVKCGETITYTVTITPDNTETNHGLMKHIQINDAKLDAAKITALTVDGAAIASKPERPVEGTKYYTAQTEGTATTITLDEATDKPIVVTYTYTVTADTPIEAGTGTNEGKQVIKNTASVKVWNVTEEKSDTDDDVVEVELKPSVSVVKFISKVGEKTFDANKKPGAGLKAYVGETIEWTIQVINSSAIAAKNVAVKDTFTVGDTPASLELKDQNGKTVDVDPDGTFTVPSVPASGTVTYTATYTVQKGDKGKTISNGASIGDAEPENPTVITVSDKDAIEVAKSVAINGKTVTGTPKAKVGDVLTYTIRVTNNGNVAYDLNKNGKFLTITDKLTAGDDGRAPDSYYSSAAYTADEATAENRFTSTFMVIRLRAKSETDTQSPYVGITYTYTVKAEDAGKKLNNVATATDAPNTPKGEQSVSVDKLISSVTKTLVTDEAYYKGNEAAGQNVTLTDDGKLVVTPNAESITLVYRFTVEGDAGASFTINDKGAALVEGSVSEGGTVSATGDGVFTGTIPEGATSVTFDVTMTFTPDDKGEYTLVNQATVENAPANIENPNPEAKSYTVTVQYVADDETDLNKPDYVVIVPKNEPYDVSKEIPEAIEGTTYVLDTVDKATAGKATSNVTITATYSVDEIGTTPGKPNEPDGTPDKYQATVTYKVVNGYWSKTGETEDKADKTVVVTLATKDANGVWTDVTELDRHIPTGMQPDTGYKPEGADWDKDPANVELKGDREYTFTYSFVKDDSTKHAVTVLVKYYKMTIAGDVTGLEPVQTDRAAAETWIGEKVATEVTIAPKKELFNGYRYYGFIDRSKGSKMDTTSELNPTYPKTLEVGEASAEYVLEVYYAPALQVTEVTKELVMNEADAEGVAIPNGVTIDYPVDGVITPKGNSVTLLYKITIKGEVGASYILTDAGATLIGAAGNEVDKIEGKIADANGDTYYAYKTFDASESGSFGALSNRASVDAGGNTVVNPADPEATVYTVTYRYSGMVPENASELPKTVIVAADTQVTASAVTAPAGYTFSGWTNAGLPIGNDGTFTMPAHNVILTGTFTAEEVTITYKVADSDTDMGTVSNASDTLNPATGTPAGSTAIAKPGYVFKNWTDANDEVVSTDAHYAPAKNASNEYETATYTAHFEAIEYTITYELNDGTVATENPTTYKVTDGNITLNNPTRDGYTFAGWSGTGLTGNGNKTVTIATGSTGDRHYVAHWTEDNHVTISYVSANETMGTVSSASESLNPAIGEAKGSEANAKPGYHFVGWYTDEACTTLAAVVTGNKLVPEKVDGLNVAATYYAKFAEDANVTITYTATTGGTVKPTSETLAPATGEAKGSTATASAGYKFSHWTDASGKAVSVSAAFVPEKVNGVNVAATYTAHFAPKDDVTIVYVAVGEGAVSSASETLKPYAAIGEAKGSEANAKPGYHFVGWYTDEACTDKVTDGVADNKLTPVKPENGEYENAVYYAKFAPDTNTKYTVKHYRQNVNRDGYVLSEEDTNLTATTGTLAVAKAKTYEGFVLNLNAAGTVSSGIVTAGENKLELALYYDLVSVSYTVEYVDGAGKELHASKTGTAAFGATVTENAENITGYKLADETKQSQNIIVAMDATKNVITFVYTEDTEDKVTITYTTDGNGTVDNTSETLLPVSGEPNGSTATANAGYKFTHWTDASDKVVSVSEAFVPAKVNGVNVAATYTAHFTQSDKVTIFYVAEAGGSIKDGKTSEDLEPATGTATGAEAVPGTGYKFDGWYLNGERIADATAAYTPVKDDGAVWTTRIYTAKFTKMSYTITYNGVEDATIAPANPATYTVESDTFTLNNPTKEGYTFLGWTGSNSNETQTNVTITKGTTGNLEYTANWEANTYTVRYQYTGTVPAGALDLPSDTTPAYGTQVNVAEAATAPAGYTFSGWTTEDAAIDNGAFTMPAHNVVFTGSFTENGKVTINYVAGEHGTVSSASESLNPATGEAKGSTAVPETGYHFVKWTDATGATVSVDATFTPSKGTGGLYADATYTANFAPNEYTVSYTIRGDKHGVDAPAAQEHVKYGETVKVADDVVAAGYTFSGWSHPSLDIDKDGKFVMPAHDLTLVGSFTANDVAYTVKYVELDAKGNQIAIAGVEDKTGTGKMDETVTENAIKIDGYNELTGEAASQSLKLGVGENVITFVYTRRNNLSYTVKYLEQGTEKVLNPARTVDAQTFGSKAEEDAVAVADYVVVGESKQTITVGTNEAENVIIFFYVAKDKLVIDAKPYVAVYDGENHKPIIGLTITEPGENGKVLYQYDPENAENNVAPAEGLAITYKVTGKDAVTSINDLADIKNVGDTPKPVEITVTYEGYNPQTVTVEAKITPKTLTITTPSASKTNNGTPLTATDGKIEGLVDGEKVELKVTGKQSELGQSKNTYELEWANGVLQSNYVIEEKLGTLIVIPSDGSTIIVRPDPNPNPGGGDVDIEDEDPPLANVDGNLNTTDHFAYIIGRGENCVQPLENITRAEVATIFFRLLTEDFRVANWSTVSSFPDVEAGAWYATEIATAERAGILKGCDDGNMQPDRDITRAEFTVMAVRFLNGTIEDDGVGDFADTANHWAAKEIRLAAKAGWIKGYGNNFRPNDPITRAEAMTIINRMLDRVPGETFPAGVIEWEDNPKGAWYYADVMEATNGHDYEREEGSVVEKWTAITPYRDWIALEAEWTANNGASAPASEEK